MAHYVLADGVFIEYTLSDLGGATHCDKAELDCTFEDRDHMKEAYDMLDELGLDDNVSLIIFINENLFDMPYAW